MTRIESRIGSAFLVSDHVVTSSPINGNLVVLPEMIPIECACQAVTHTINENEIVSVHTDGTVRKVCITKEAPIITAGKFTMNHVQGIFFNGKTIVVSSLKRLYTWLDGDLTVMPKEISTEYPECTILATNQQSKIIDLRFLNVSSYSGGHLWQLWDLEKASIFCFAKAEIESQLVSSIAASDGFISAIIGDKLYIWQISTAEIGKELTPFKRICFASQITAQYMDKVYLLVGDMHGTVTVIDKITQSKKSSLADLVKIPEVMRSRVKKLARFGQYVICARANGSIALFSLFSDLSSALIESKVQGNIANFNIFDSEINLLIEPFSAPHKFEIHKWDQKIPKKAKDIMEKPSLWNATQVELIEQLFTQTIQLANANPQLRILELIRDHIATIKATNYQAFCFPNLIFLNICDGLQSIITNLQTNSKRKVPFSLITTLGRQLFLLSWLINKLALPNANSNENENESKSESTFMRALEPKQQKRITKKRNQSVDFRDNETAALFGLISVTSEIQNTPNTSSIPRPQKHTRMKFGTMRERRTRHTHETAAELFGQSQSKPLPQLLPQSTSQPQFETQLEQASLPLSHSSSQIPLKLPTQSQTALSTPNTNPLRPLRSAENGTSPHKTHRRISSKRKLGNESAGSTDPLLPSSAPTGTSLVSADPLITSPMNNSPGKLRKSASAVHKVYSKEKTENKAKRSSSSLSTTQPIEWNEISPESKENPRKSRRKTKKNTENAEVSSSSKKHNHVSRKGLKDSRSSDSSPLSSEDFPLIKTSSTNDDISIENKEIMQMNEAIPSKENSSCSADDSTCSQECLSFSEHNSSLSEAQSTSVEVKATLNEETSTIE